VASRGDRARAAAGKQARRELVRVIPSGRTVAGAGPVISTPGGEAPVIPVMLILLGAYLAWFGAHYWRDKRTIWPSDPVKDVLQGRGLPAPDRRDSVAQQVAKTSPAGHYDGTVTGKAIAAAIERYKGKVPYRWGKASPRGWDCSGAPNYVVCHICKLSIPGSQGGTFTGQEHGPNVADWLAWDGVRPVAEPAPGDLVCWGPNQHMGIAISATHMISAEDPKYGTAEAAIAGFFPWPPVVLRLRELEAYAGGGSASKGKAAGRLLAAGYGWAPGQNPAQWAALDKLWTQESGWRDNATNPSSGAYGIPQALPGDKMAADGSNWRTSDNTQVKWGLHYIKERYGTPEAAWAHERENGWY
jgi:hypothetical protein